MSESGLRRVSVVALAASLLWLGAWGMDRILARSRADARLDPPPGMLVACENELRSRLPAGAPLRIAEDYRVQRFGAAHLRLLSRFESPASGPTTFACDVIARTGSWEVSEITVVRW